MEDIANKLNIREVNEWYSISKEDFISKGGQELLESHKSIYEILKTAYPSVDWMPWQFTSIRSVPKGFWQTMAVRRQYLDFVTKQLNVQTMEDWYNVSGRDVMKIRGGATFLSLYQGSLLLALKSVYPEHKWEEWKFRKVTKGSRLPLPVAYFH